LLALAVWPLAEALGLDIPATSTLAPTSWSNESMQWNGRQFITLVGGAAAWPLAASAQQSERMRRVGVLIQFAESNPEGQARVAAFREELQRLGTMITRAIAVLVNIVVSPSWVAAHTVWCVFVT
jgi:hypothetical protein